MKGIPVGGCVYVYLLDDFNFSRIPDNKQNLEVPLHRAGIGQCTVVLLLTEDENSLAFCGHSGEELC